MHYTLGQKFVSLYDEKKAQVVAVRVDGEWEIEKDFKTEPNLHAVMFETDQDVILFAESEWGEEYITDYNLQNYDSWSDDLDWTVLITEEVATKHKEVSDKIVALLEQHGVETSDLIVSDGRAYVGYTACANYIEATGAWVPSSMQC